MGADSLVTTVAAFTGTNTPCLTWHTRFKDPLRLMQQQTVAGNGSTEHRQLCHCSCPWAHPAALQPTPQPQTSCGPGTLQSNKHRHRYKITLNQPTALCQRRRRQPRGRQCWAVRMCSASWHAPPRQPGWTVARTCCWEPVTTLRDACLQHVLAVKQLLRAGD